jgi:ssRNA-specific RNase YbeY (16S rRNA maturation enzyme)
VGYFILHPFFYLIFNKNYYIIYIRGEEMRKIRIFYKDKAKETDVLLLPSKNKKYYSFINLTKGHICPCKFKTEEEAIEDLRSYKNIQFFIELKGEKWWQD